MSSVGYHEPVSELSEETRDMHRAIVSLMEELEAVDWYNQRADAAKDPELKAILQHNRDEEKEHAAMVRLCRAGDVTAACKLLTAHIRHAGTELIAFIGARTAAPPVNSGR